MEIVEDRYQAGSTVITSQLPVDARHAVIDEPTFADAILDRVRGRARAGGALAPHSTTPIGWRSTARPSARATTPASRRTGDDHSQGPAMRGAASAHGGKRRAAHGCCRT